MNGLMLHFGAPANPVIRPVPPGVYVDGRRRRDLHVTGWHVAAAPDFGKAAVELTPAGRCASARRIEHIRALPPVGSRLQICLPASSRPVVFDGYVVKHCGAVDPEGESLTAEVEDVLKVQLAGIPAGRWQSSDGAAVFLPEGQLAFNDDRQAHLASAEPLAVNGRMCRVFQPGPEGQLWSVLDILKFLVAAYARADLAVCGLEDASGPAAGIYPPRLSLEGLSLGEALSRVADLAGLAIRGSVTGPVGQVQRGLLFYRPGRTGCRRTVSLQRAGQALDSRRSNLLSGRIEFRSRPARRGLILLGGIKRHESTFALQPGWDRRKESYHYRDFVRGESADWLPVADVFRKWVLNETGRYCQEPYNLTRFDLASVSDDFLTASPRRFESCLSRDPAGASPGVVVEISTDGGETWRRYPGPVRIAGDECAVYLADDALGADYFQAALARTVALRVTATVASDRRLTAARAGDPGGGTVVHEAPSAGWAKVHSGSIFYRRADLPPAAERDDSDRLAALAEAVAASPAGGVEAELSLAWLDATRTVGDIVAAIAGRQLLLAALPDSWPYVCQVRHDCREWVTRLTVRG